MAETGTVSGTVGDVSAKTTSAETGMAIGTDVQANLGAVLQGKGTGTFP